MQRLPDSGVDYKKLINWKSIEPTAMSAACILLFAVAIFAWLAMKFWIETIMGNQPIL